MNFVDEMKINDANHGTPIFLGATMKAMARRFQFLVEGWKGINDPLSSIYILAGHRPLIEKLEGKETVPSIMKETGFSLSDGWEKLSQEEWPKTETEVAMFLIRFGGISVNCEFVDLPLVNGKPPTTHSTTVELFKRFGNSSKRWLVVSSQPYCLNQLMTVKRAAAEVGINANFSVCGPSAPADLPLARILDCVAKQLWEEVQ